MVIGVVAVVRVRCSAIVLVARARRWWTGGYVYVVVAFGSSVSWRLLVARYVYISTLSS